MNRRRQMTTAADRREHPGRFGAGMTGAMAVVVAAIALLASCGTAGDVPGANASSATRAPTTVPGTISSIAPRPRTGTSATSGTTETTPGSTGTTATARVRHALAGFDEITITVHTGDGQTLTWCLLLADTNQRREQGLMRVSDPTLGGYDGMLFAFDRDSDDGFWMKNTLLPLSLAYLEADGTTRSTVDMAPCPATAPTCPTYPSGGPYRNAIEVPQGELPRLGIDDRSVVTLGPKTCS